MEHTIHGLVKKRGEIAGQHKVAVQAQEAIKADLDAIDRALVLCGYQDDPKGIAPHGKYKQLFGRNELKLTVINLLREAPADDEAIVAHIMAAKPPLKDVRLARSASLRWRIPVDECRQSRNRIARRLMPRRSVLSTRSYGYTRSSSVI